MRDFRVTRSQDGLHVVKACQEAYPQLKSADLFHALKRRDIRIDGKKINKDIAVKEGNVVEIWLPDELFDGAAKAAPKAKKAPAAKDSAESKPKKSTSKKAASEKKEEASAE